MKETRIDYILDGVVLTSAAASIEQTIQIVLLVLGCVSSAISIAYTIYKWWKKAKADGKITKEEIKEGVDLLQNEVENLDDKLKRRK